MGLASQLLPSGSEVLQQALSAAHAIQDESYRAAALGAIAPPAAHASTGTVNVTIDVQPTETYDTLVRRAEAIVAWCRA